MLLSNCKYIVGGKTCGSWAACMLADVNTKIDIFELGYYWMESREMIFSVVVPVYNVENI